MNSSNPIFSPGRLGHVNLAVDDLSASISFYRDVCGLNLEFTESGIKGAFMGTGLTPHDVGMIETGASARKGRDGQIQVKEGAVRKAGLNHIAWEVDTEEELVNAYRRALELETPPTFYGFDHRIAKSLYMKDPDGNTVEFYADSVREWRDLASGDVQLITSAWVPGAESPATDPRWAPLPDRRSVPDAILQPLRLSHVVLQTPQLEAMLRFYTGIAGLSVLHVSRNGALLRARRHDSTYQLALVPEAKASFHHVAFSLADQPDFETAVEHLRKRPEVEWKLHDGPIKESIFLQDPDGFLVEFFHAKSGEVAQAMDITSDAERVLAL